MMGRKGKGKRNPNIPKQSSLQKSSPKKREKLYQCSACNKKFMTDYYLQRHKAIYCRNRPKKCRICKILMKFTDDIRAHQRVHPWLRVVNKYMPFKCKAIAFIPDDVGNNGDDNEGSYDQEPKPSTSKDSSGGYGGGSNKNNDKRDDKKRNNRGKKQQENAENENLSEIFIKDDSGISQYFEEDAMADENNNIKESKKVITNGKLINLTKLLDTDNNSVVSEVENGNDNEVKPIPGNSNQLSVVNEGSEFEISASGTLNETQSTEFTILDHSYSRDSTNDGLGTLQNRVRNAFNTESTSANARSL